MKQTIISKKPVFEAKFFTVNELEIEIKPNVIRTHHNVEIDPIVYVFPLTNEGDIYLTTQYRYNLGKEMLDGVAGYIDEGEDPLTAAKRELKEEAGIEAKKWDLLCIAERGAGSVLTKIYMYVAQDLIFGETKFDESEDISLVKMSLADAVQKVLDGEITIVSGMTGLLLLDKLKQLGKL